MPVIINRQVPLFPLISCTRLPATVSTGPRLLNACTKLLPPILVHRTKFGPNDTLGTVIVMLFPIVPKTVLKLSGTTEPLSLRCIAGPLCNSLHVPLLPMPVVT